LNTSTLPSKRGNWKTQLIIVFTYCIYG